MSDLKRKMKHVDYIVIHCAATFSNQNIGADDIDNWHRAKGWNGCGYHFVIKRDGTIESEQDGHPCRAIDEAGAHVGSLGHNLNRRSIGICLVGGAERCPKTEKPRPQKNFTEAQWESLDDLVYRLKGLEQYKNTDIVGHRDLIKKYNGSFKMCPCFNVQEWLVESGFKNAA